MPKRINMKKTLIYAAAFTLASAALISPGSKLDINFNKVKQPIRGPTSVYRFSAKGVGSNEEIPVGVARFRTY